MYLIVNMPEKGKSPYWCNFDSTYISGLKKENCFWEVSDWIFPKNENERLRKKLLTHNYPVNEGGCKGLDIHDPMASVCGFCTSEADALW